MVRAAEGIGLFNGTAVNLGADARRNRRKSGIHTERFDASVWVQMARPPLPTMCPPCLATAHVDPFDQLTKGLLSSASMKTVTGGGPQCKAEGREDRRAEKSLAAGCPNALCARPSLA
ncbi:hypothetical protein AAFF_G00413450 [Aldrovandia affinis]|uniref:Uncharacterized protein n=1 Tax=Aldrovandia affinis TaxID=143900 RepID=A0AAD7SBK3_9TELE|nr:hypothetical protein AAFF_G00413450 [Aldrovandia affinis]